MREIMKSDTDSDSDNNLWWGAEYANTFITKMPTKTCKNCRLHKTYNTIT